MEISSFLAKKIVVVVLRVTCPDRVRLFVCTGCCHDNTESTFRATGVCSKNKKGTQCTYNIVARSRNHFCSGNATSLSLCIAEPHVTVIH